MGLLKRFIIFLFCVVLLTGCGGLTSSSAPIISNMVFSPSSVLLNQDGGQVIVTVTFDFIDIDGDLSTFTITPSSNNPISGPIVGILGNKSGSINLSVTVLTNVSGNFPFSLIVTDTSGNKSNNLFGTFTVN